MNKFKIELFPSPILRRESKKVRSFGKPLISLLSKMETYMKSQPSGIGLAAPQIGIDQQIAIVDVSERVKGAKCLYLCNPQILTYESEIISREGCMSLPEYRADLRRFNRIYLKWQREDGAWVKSWFEGIEARCIQHEVDHLSGIMFIDKVVSLKSDVIPRRFKNKKKQ